MEGQQEAGAGAERDQYVAAGRNTPLNQAVDAGRAQPQNQPKQGIEAGILGDWMPRGSKATNRPAIQAVRLPATDLVQTNTATTSSVPATRDSTRAPTMLSPKGEKTADQDSVQQRPVVDAVTNPRHAVEQPSPRSQRCVQLVSHRQPVQINRAHEHRQQHEQQQAHPQLAAALGSLDHPITKIQTRLHGQDL